MRRRAKREQIKSKMERMAEAIDIPKDVVSGCSKITVYGDNQLIVENYKGILEYGDSIIRIKTGHKIMSVSGEKLSVCGITDNDIMIEGKFVSMGWE